MNLRQLAYFAAVAEHRSFLKASEVLHISQPSVSAQIRLLEEELEVQLFERRPGGTVLTPEGKDFLVHARTVLDTLEAARASLRSHQAAEVGRVAVGIPGSFSPVLSLPLIEAVQRECPNVRLKVVSGLSGHVYQWILDGTLDFGLMYEAAPVNGLDMDLLLSEHLVAVARERSDLADRLTAAGEIRLAQLAGLPLVLPGRDHGLRKLVDEAARKIGIGLDVSTELDAHELLTEMVRRTGCFTILSLAALRARSAGEPLFTARVIEPAIERRVSVAHASGRPLSRAARRVEAIMRELLRAEIGQGWWKSATPLGLARGK